MFPVSLRTVRDPDFFDFFHFAPSTRNDVQFVEEKEKYTFTIDLPGFKKEDVNIDIQDDHLSIKAKRKQEHDKDAKFYHRTGNSSEKSVRYSLPKDILIDKVSAKLEDGLLSINLPKKAEAKPKQITIH